MAVPAAVQSTRPPSRPRTAQPLHLPQPFASSSRAAFKEPTPRPSLSDLVLSRLHSRSSKDESNPHKPKNENKLKRTFDEVVTSVEKMARKFKVMPSRFPDLEREEREDGRAQTPTDEKPRRSTLRYRPSLSGRSIRTARDRRGSRVEKPPADRSSFNTTIFESRLGILSRKRSELDQADIVPTSSASVSSLTNPVRLLPYAFPAEAGAGARAAVKAALQHIQSPPLTPEMLSSHLLQHDSPIESTVQFSLCERQRDDSLYDWDRMDVDPCESEPGEALVTCPDPLTRVPVEVVEIIFSFLDMPTLALLRSVSRNWEAVANSNHVWREVFLRTYGPLAAPNPWLSIGGRGLGYTGKGFQDYRAMAVARQKLDMNWRAHDPRAIYFCGHTDSVYCCQFDETKIITGSRDRTIRVWDLNTYQCLKVIGAPSSKPKPPSSSTFGLETHKKAVQNIVSLNGTPEGDAIFHSPAYFHEASILCLQYDEQIMVTGSSDTTCIVWDITTFEPLARLRRHAAGVLDICFDSRYIISCSKDHTICIWSRDTFALLKVLGGHLGPVNAVQMRGNMLVSASGDGNAKLWDLTTMKPLRTFSSKDRGLAAVEFSDDGRYILAGGNDQVIYKYNANTCELIHVYTGHTNLVRSLFLDYNNRRVLSGSYDQGMRVYDFDTGEEMGVYNNWTTSWILAAKCDYRRIVATSQDGRVLMMDFGYEVPNVNLLRDQKPEH